jgi:hypothetical protein
MVLKLIF